MTVAEVLAQITVANGVVTSKTTGVKYSINTFIEQISAKLKWTSRQRKDLESHFSSFLKVQSDSSKHIEAIIDKYEFQFSDGVYIVKKAVMTLEEIYRLLWKEERLLPTDVDSIIENIEKISEQIELQAEIFKKIYNKEIAGKSKYLESLYTLYPNEKWHDIFYNIIVPKTNSLFHIFYDNGIGGTGKSTILEVITKIVGENFTSNVLLDQFGNRFIFANMLGKYVNIGDDNGKNEELQNVGTLKSIVTGNRITIDRKNISPLDVKIFAKQLYATNLFPYIDFTDGGIMRRLNVIEMNRVIPKTIKLCNIDDNETGHIIYEVLKIGKDLKENNNSMAIKSNPLYRFYLNESDKSYSNYKNFCDNNGFRKLNIINFETKLKFIKHYCIENLTKDIKDIMIKSKEEEEEELCF